MAVTNFTLKISGTVAYTDNSHGSFESTANWLGQFGGLVAQHNTADSEFHFNQLLADKPDDVNQLLAILGGSFSLSPPISLPDRTVDSFIMEISGTVSYDDNTRGAAFIAQWIDGAIDLFPVETVINWGEITVPGSAMVNFVDEVFETLAGGDGASIT